jgi:hypothetical protein
MRKGIVMAAALAGTFVVATGLIIAAQSTFGIGAIPPRKPPEAPVAATVFLPPIPVEATPAPATALAATPAAATLGNVDVSVVRKAKNAKADKNRTKTQKSGGLPTQSASRLSARP